MKGKNLTIYIIVCLLAIALVVWGFLMFYPNNQVVNKNSNLQTASTTKIPGWLPYQSIELRFDCQYPSDWKIVGDEANVPEWLTSPEPNSIGNGINFYKKSTTQTYPSKDFPLDALISIFTINNPNDLSVQEFLKKEYDDCMYQAEIDESCPDYENGLDWQPITIDGKSALRSGKKPSIVSFDTVYIPLQKKFLVIEATYYNPQYSVQLSDIFNKFISSFKFMSKDVNDILDNLKF